MIYYYFIAMAAALCWAVASLVSADVTRTIGGLAFNRLRLFFVPIGNCKNNTKKNNKTSNNTNS